MRITCKVVLSCLAFTSMILSSGCKRSDDATDTRTLEQRPHTETVRPVDRSDAFRP